MRPPSSLDWLVLLLLAAVWGCSFLMIKWAVQVFDPLQMSMWRMVQATVIYLPVALIYWSKIDWTRWKPLVVVAFCGSAIPNLLFAAAQRHVDSSLAGILNSLTPLFTLVLGVLFFQLKLTRNKALGVALGLLGAALLILFNGKAGLGGNAFYAVLCALATVCYAINANMVGKYLRDQHPAAIASAAFMLTGGLFFVGLWWSDGWSAAWQHPDGPKALTYILYLSALGTVGGSIVYFWLLQRTSPVFATSVTYLLPIAAMVLGLFDGELIGMMDMAGTGVILTGLYLARK